MTRPIRTILIANRGEIALRIIRTCRELGIRTIAVYSDADRSAPHVRAADSAIPVGPAPSSLSYLNVPAILEAARSGGADAIHPGYGFLSENSAFAKAVGEAGFVFVGPSPAAIAMMGDKTRAREVMRKAGVPVVPGSDAPLQSEQEAVRFVQRHGTPVLIKAAAGGGGKGMRRVDDPREIAGAYHAASSEAKASFGDARVYIEQYLDQPRHIEVQILADSHGSVVHLGERECSIQRRHQKIVEESPSPILDDESRRRMTETAVRAAQACGYVNAGTVEFLRDASGKFYFLEMNTRLQVEHPVTELRTGLDLVALQIRIAEGARLPFRQEDVRWNGHAIECRICAEDVEHSYIPSTGRLLHVHPAAGPGIREDRGVDEGGEVSIYYDPMIAKLCAWGANREQAMQRMIRALEEYEILGVQTNISLLRFVLRHPAFQRGEISTHFLQEHYTPEQLDRGSEEFQRAAAVLCAMLEDRKEKDKAPQTGTGEQQGSPWRRLRFEGYRS
ncbi:MAG: acetyl-CoA carboxylase biotin carboxylase subunit [Bacteroidota bacterium]